MFREVEFLAGAVALLVLATGGLTYLGLIAFKAYRDRSREKEQLDEARKITGR